MIYFITGNSGTGKTTIAQELTQRGHEVHDVDDFMARWRNDLTGFVHPKSSVKSTDRTPQFLNEHSWVVEREMVESLADRADSKDIFIVGLIYNYNEIADLFQKAFVLDVSDQVLGDRLTHRTNNDWGKTAHELKMTLARQNEIRKTYQDFGCITIDANRPIRVVVDDIVSQIDN